MHYPYLKCKCGEDVRLNKRKSHLKTCKGTEMKEANKTAYTIKGLEWVEGVPSGEEGATVDTGIGEYLVIQDGDCCELHWYPEPRGFDNHDYFSTIYTGNIKSIEDGKAKAEAHYRQLMESCLEVVE